MPHRLGFRMLQGANLTFTHFYTFLHIFTFFYVPVQPKFSTSVSSQQHTHNDPTRMLPESWPHRLGFRIFTMSKFNIYAFLHIFTYFYIFLCSSTTEVLYIHILPTTY